MSHSPTQDFFKDRMESTGWIVPASRIAIGLLQALMLVFLIEAARRKIWPATDGLFFAPLLAMAVFVPAIVISGLGNLRPRTLAVWTIVAAIFCAGIALHEIAREPVVRASEISIPWIVPFGVWLPVMAILFVVHSLTLAGDAERKLIASYPSYFDVAWKLGVQLWLALGFVAVLMALLYLGGELFDLIKIRFVADLLNRRSFWIPACALGFNCAVHVTDVRQIIVRGAQTLVLILLSWLLPVFTLIAAIFVGSLPFTGLEPLWATRQATTILLACAAILIFLINASYQDGRPDNRAAAMLRYAGVVARVILVPLVAIAAYALMLRVQQYGWTPERIIAVACVAVAGSYTLGYVIAMARRGVASKALERTNVLTSIFIVAVLLAFGSPVGDPARLSVADQIRRLRTGEVAPEQFDFYFLRFQSGRYGVEALERLAAQKDGPQASAIAERAGRILSAMTAWEARNKQEVRPPPLTPERRAANIAVIFPSGAALPDGFARQDWGSDPQRGVLPACLRMESRCEAVLADLDDDGKAEILLFGTLAGGGLSVMFKADEGGTWSYVGPLGNKYCNGVSEAVRAGNFRIVEPQFKEIEANGWRLRVTTGCAINANAAD